MSEKNNSPSVASIDTDSSPSGANAAGSRRGMALVFITSFVLLFVEMIQPKIFQFIKFYGHELAVVAIAMLGIGIGGMACYLIGRYSGKWVVVFSIIFPVAVIITFLISSLFNNYLLVVVSSSAFYFIASVIIGLHFLGYPSHRVYFSNLLGSGLGIAAVYWLLPVLGGEGCMFLAAALAALGALIFAGTRRRLW